MNTKKAIWAAAETIDNKLTILKGSFLLGHTETPPHSDTELS